MKIRIKFAKRGSMKFIGHLDVMRYFQKAMRRAEVDIAYTEGFSPHQKMSFAAPLGVGLMSEGEYFDIEVNSFSSSEKMKQALNEVMVEGFEVISCRVLPEHAKNAMSIVAAADYRIEGKTNGISSNMGGNGADFWEGFLDFIVQDRILIVKTTKKGEREMDLKPLIYRGEREEYGVFLTLCTGSTDNVKPELVLEAYYEKQGMLMPECGFSVTRLELYADVGEDGKRELLSLESLGEEIG